MVEYSRHDGTWIVAPTAKGVRSLRGQMSDKQYDDSKIALQEFLCEYFSIGNCADRLGTSINPMGATESGGKIFKVRWALPGSGKSGSIRIVIVVFCEKRTVYIAEAFRRNVEPSTEAVEQAAGEVSRPVDSQSS